MRSLIIKLIWLLTLPLVMGYSGHNGRLPSETIDLKKTTHDSLGQAVMIFDRLIHDFGTIIEGEL